MAFIDNSVEAGDDFENWIQICKQQLTERENKLMVLRTSTLQSIINTQCASFEAIHSYQHSAPKIVVANYDKVITTTLINQCLDKLNQLLSLWNGINLRKTKQPPATFQKYFAMAKSWFDQKKKVILAPDFWIKFFVHLQQFVSDAASTCLDNRFQEVRQPFAMQLLFQILSGIFAGELPYAGTKGQPLVACAIVKDNKAMKDYLHSLHHTLNIDAWMRKGGTRNAKELLVALNKQLASLTDQYQMEFQEAFHALSNDVSHTNRNTNTSHSIIANTSIQTMDSLPSFGLSISSTPSTPTNICDDINAPRGSFYPDEPQQPHPICPPSIHLISCQCVMNEPMQSRDTDTYTHNHCPWIPPVPVHVPNMSAQVQAPIVSRHNTFRSERIPFQRYINTHHTPSHVSCAPHTITPPTQMPSMEHKSSETVQYPEVESVVPEDCGPLEPFESFASMEPLEPLFSEFDLMSPDPFVSFDMMPDSNDYESYGGYNGNHARSQSVMTQRFSPMKAHSSNAHSNCNYI